jgi:tRNA A-37 threonylcarbamoyl transferase component Bud32
MSSISDDPDEAATVIRGPGVVAARAAPEAQGLQHDDALALGSRLGEFEIVSLVGVGGFGIVYLALDHSLGRRVALKEYMPQALAFRDRDAQVKVRSARHADTFEAGRRSFVNEAKLLAQFDHPSLVKVYRFWEANGTAYMVMPFYEGRTLGQTLRARAEPPDQAWLERLLGPLFDALDLLHRANVYHRDIAPDNIMLLADDRPLLLDFGAARRVISDMTQALTVILKPGYAPIEQYAEMADMKQGAWTDVYALAAVVYSAIVGKTPPPAVNRLLNDTLAPLAEQAAGRYSSAFLQTIDAALSVKPTDRPQTVAAFRARLGLASAAAVPTAPQQDRPAAPAGAGVVVDAPAKSMRRIIIAVALGGMVAAGLVWLRRASDPGLEQASAPAPAASRTAASSSPSVGRPPLDPLAELDRVFERRNRAHNVGVVLRQAQVVIGRDKLSFNVRSTRPGYLYVLMVGTDHQHLYLLFPNQIDPDNRIAANEPVGLPSRGWSMVAGGPAGTNHFVAFVAEHPRDFQAAGLTPVGGTFAEFPLDRVRSETIGTVDAAPPFVGKAVCPGATQGCSESYGAAVFTIEEVEGDKR